MRLKGISVFEQHVEKAVAGLFALALLGVLAWQFLGGQSTVQVDKDKVPITAAYARIGENARRLNSSLQATQEAPDPKAVGDARRRFEDFDKSLTAPVAPREQFAGALDHPPALFHDGKSFGPSADAPIAEVVIPAPVNPVAATYLGTVSTAEQQHPGVAKILPAVAPFDKASVTVEAVFDGTALRAVFEHDPDGDKGPIRAVPRGWWENGLQILAVELFRQTLKADGTWSAPERVKGMPGRAVVVDRADALNDAESIKEAMRLASDTEMVRRTPYYDVSMGDKWVAPSEREAMAEAGQSKAAEVRSLRQIVAAADQRIKRIDEQLQKSGQPPVPAPGAGGGGAGGRGGRGGGGGGIAPPTAPQPSGPGSAEDPRRKGLLAAREREVAMRARAIDRLRELGEVVEGADNMATQTTQDQQTAAKAEPPVLDNPSIHVWAHDVFVERGQTYRYQIGLVFTNPYFGHSAAMVPAQAQKLARSGTIRSAPSEWTQPVAVDRETYTFFVSAVEDDAISGARAYTRAEVFQFKWGFWRRGSDSFEPGDRVSLNINVPDFTKFLPAAPGPGQGNEPPAPMPGQGRPGGGRGGGATAPAGGAPSSGPGGDAIVIPTGTQIPMIPVSVPSDELILSIGHGPSRGSGARSAEVFVREGGGGVRAVQPDLEKNNPVFIRVSRSADRGDKERTAPLERPRPTHEPGPGAFPPPGRDLPPGGGDDRGGGGGG
ncbi:MAG TPA: hypothetical protein PKE29_11070 [Phycisphaerales bacterium]|nr:hypothetical protein [Phycisphaerales bacterium]